MKKLLWLVLSIIFVSSQISAQMKKGDVELSLSGSFGSFSEKVEGTQYNYDGEAKTYFFLSGRPGFFLMDGLELEPEVGLFIMSDSDPGYNFSVNLAYNFIPESNVYPFITAGAGYGNAIQLLGITSRVSDDFNVFNLNLGAGIKIMINDFVGTRIEYRYQSFSYSQQEIDFSYITHRLMFGFSIFL